MKPLGDRTLEKWMDEDMHVNQNNKQINTGIPQTVLTTPQLVFAAADIYSDLPAIQDENQLISYAQLPAEALAVCRALIAQGVKPGDRIGLWAPNSGRWVLAALGLQMAGAVLVPLNTRMKPLEAADVLERSGCSLLFTAGDFLGSDYPAQLAEVCPKCVKHMVLMTPREAEPLADNLSWNIFIESGRKVSGAVAMQSAMAVDSEDMADLMFTSGTTGKPKGVMSSHGSCLRAFRQFVNILGVVPGDRYLVVNPFFHAFGYKAGWVSCLLAGACILPQAVFDADAVLQRIERDKITVLPGPPTLYLSLLAHPKLAQTDLSSLRIAVTGAATIPPILIERMRHELGFSVVTTAYGLTECGGLATICHPHDDASTIAATSGCTIAGTDISVQSSQGEMLGANVPGEICLRGFHVMQGYFQNPDATAEAIDSDGWLHTGDIGTLDERGYLTITGRLKDMFIVGGFNCYPAEIEAVLIEHNAIAQCAVIGVEDERMGEVGCAYIVRIPDQPLIDTELISWCRERMANYKVPRYVRFIDHMPVNASNKIIKAQLSDHYLAQAQVV